MTYPAPSVSLGVVLKTYIGKWVMFGIYICGKVGYVCYSLRKVSTYIKIIIKIKINGGGGGGGGRRGAQTFPNSTFHIVKETKVTVM